MDFVETPGLTITVWPDVTYIAVAVVVILVSVSSPSCL